MSEQFAFPFEQYAKHDGPMPDGLDLADQMAFTTLRNIYHSFFTKAISREQASKEKSALRSTWAEAKSRDEMHAKMVERQLKLIKATAAACDACRLNPTPENAIALCNATDGIDAPYRPKPVQEPEPPTTKEPEPEHFQFSVKKRRGH